MSEEYLVRYASPTLAGIKTGSLFMCPLGSAAETISVMSGYNTRLRAKGLCMIPLKSFKGKVLIYIFRPKRLREDLSREGALGLLRERGYKSRTAMGLIAELRKRLEEGGEFPHEIGLFLGYPEEDVRGFIENRASDYKILGTYKVYGDAEQAKRSFMMYRRCTESLSRQLNLGKTLSELTVAV